MTKFLLLIPFLLTTFVGEEPMGGLAVGEKAPAIQGKDANGDDVKWDELLKKGPVIVVFYRGSWCPFCNVYLASLMKEYPNIQEYGSIVAITPQKPDNIDKTLKKNKIIFPVVYDEGGLITRAYKSVSAKHGVPMFKGGQYDGSILPVPATYIIDQNGVVSKRHFDENFKVRMEIPELIAELKRLTRK